MADVTISDLPIVTSPNISLQIPVSDGSTTQKMSVGQILDLQSGIPIGTIVMWSNRGGASIPSGWQICDGTNGTPDLRDRFIVGSGSSYAINSTGGSTTAFGSTDSTTLTINQIPAHTHSYTYNQGSSTNGGSCGANVRCSGVGGTTSSVGGGQGHSHTISSITTIPPYYALAYIQKIS